MEKKFERYVANIVRELDCSEEEKAEIAEELYDHLWLLKQEFLEKGYGEKQAVKLAISSFGDEKEMGSGLQNSLFPYLKFVKLGGAWLWVMLSLLLLKEGVNLMDRAGKLDGTGTGVYFLLFEINDKVPNQDIASYVYGFFAASVLAALMPVVFFNKKFLRYVNSVWSSAG